MGAVGGLALSGALAATGGGARRTGSVGISGVPTLAGVETPGFLSTRGNSAASLQAVEANRLYTNQLTRQKNIQNQRYATRNNTGSTAPTLLGG